MDHFWTSLVTVATAIIGVAIIAVLVSQRSQTVGVITAAGNAFANDLSAATGPVTGAVTAPNVGGGGFGGFSGGAGFQQSY